MLLKMFFPLNYIKLSAHRNFLEDYLKKELPKLKGSILDIGSGSRRYDYLLTTKPVAIDIIPNEAKEITFGDVNDLQFPDAFFDNIICLEVFEYLKDPQKAIKEIYRVLKPGGTAIISCPFMYKVHQDQLRYTADFWQNVLLLDFAQKEIKPIGNFYSIILDIWRGKIAKIKLKPIRWILYLPYLFFVLFVPFSKISKDPVYVSGYFIITQK